MQDFTLVIPTYNRPKLLEALLTYLSAQPQRCHVLVLDSSQPQPRAANRKIVELAELKLDYAEFPSEMHPFDKFREGVHKVATEFCALCADERRPVKAAKACSNSPENPIVGKQTLHSHDGIDRIWKMLEDVIEDDGIERAIATQVLRETPGSTAKPLLRATAPSGPGSLPCTIIPRRCAASRNHPFPHPGSSRRASLRVL